MSIKGIFLFQASRELVIFINDYRYFNVLSLDENF